MERKATTKKITEKKENIKTRTSSLSVSNVGKEKYFQSVGRRKTSVACVRIFAVNKKDSKDVEINNKTLQEYFPLMKHQKIVLSPMNVISENYKISVKVSGGGTQAQAEAVRLGISKALTVIKKEWHQKLKSFGFMTRDPRMVESKKFGRRKARRKQQWRKR